MPKVDIYKLKAGTKPPLIGVHGAGGMLFFGTLAMHLDADQPLVVLQGEGLDRVDAPLQFSSIHELSDKYARAIMDLNAGEPVVLCGRMAAIVLETGRRLLEFKREVQALIVFDVGIGENPNRQPSSSEASPKGLMGHCVRYLKMIPGIGGLRTKVRNRIAPPRPRKHRPFRDMNDCLKEGYQSKEYGGKVVLIRSEKYARLRDWDHHPDSWRSVAAEFETYVTAGTHSSMWHQPNIELLGKRVQGLLDEMWELRKS